MHISTQISATTAEGHRIRGHALLTLLEERSFSEVIVLLWRGNFPTPAEKDLLEMLLVAGVEHGAEVPSLFVPRVVASTGGSLAAALAAGILTVGEKHGGAVEAAARLLSSRTAPETIVQEHLAAGRVIPGFGHKIYKDDDPRATAIAARARALRFPCRAFERAYAIETALSRAKGKKLPLNLDGALAAGLVELEFPPRYGNMLFILPRLVGMAAHVVEEQGQHRGYVRLPTVENAHTHES